MPSLLSCILGPRLLRWQSLHGGVPKAGRYTKPDQKQTFSLEFDEKIIFFSFSSDIIDDELF
jgi:hypothetical protein